VEPESRRTPPRWLDGLEEAALRAMPPPVGVFVRSGSYGEESVREATAAWRTLRFRTRVLRGVGAADLTTSLLGTPLASPIAVAPTSMQRAVHPGGERELAAGVAESGTLQVVSSNAGTRFGSIGGGPWWLQAYLPTDRDVMVPVLEAAVAAGATAVVLTVDTPFPGTKYAAEAEDWTGIDLDWWRLNFADPKPDRWARDLTPADVTWLRERAGVPVVVKGVLRGDDARTCLDAGADAVYVSNHGGRQLDRAVPTAVALREVVAAVGEHAEVYVDGGIRSGLDVLAALGLGARGVFVGRPVLYGLALDGARGVARVLADLGTELREALELAGCATPADALDLLDADPWQAADLG
jgi:4-hydroxymandelate oxidase